jgi:hypothetical protein
MPPQPSQLRCQSRSTGRKQTQPGLHKRRCQRPSASGLTLLWRPVRQQAELAAAALQVRHKRGASRIG